MTIHPDRLKYEYLCEPICVQRTFIASFDEVMDWMENNLVMAQAMVDLARARDDAAGEEKPAEAG